MTFSAALSGAALRVMRTAAGRRALQLALLVCGLFALGLLYGEQAHATDGVTSTTSAEAVRQTEPGGGVLAATRATAGRLGSPSAERADEPAGDAIEAVGSDADSFEADSSKSASPEPNPSEANSPEVNSSEANSPEVNSSEADSPEVTVPQRPQADKALPQPRTPRPADRILRPVTEDVVAPVTERVVRPVTEEVVGSVDERVVRPVGDLVGGVTEGLAEARWNIPPLSLPPSLPVTPESPVLPEFPGALLPGLPELPLLPVLPGQSLPAPVTSTPQPAPDAGVDGKAMGDGASEQRTDGAAAVMYGPMFVADVTPAGDATHAVGHRVQPTEYAPDQQAPGGDPGGALGNRSAADNGASRHGDAHAVALHHRAPLRLMAGAAARHDAGETRDRHPDIPVSPA
ncbi:hypothetical protein QQY66_30100 [Streptomyces sp. DG2A-72]|uniref:hypothetical protein n=1 Tax=Streptomyces sp. DG2A-72 TaxID=3051386 RepID=UPI00265C6C57|nr:hypothetical protein [Streptomyces sp. DG2A-72]MDO0935725.1 hypothetical protein [Streptomyces sp. DG2A-72]